MAKRPTPQSKEELDSVTDGFFASLRGESARGCVLVAAAFLDESLEALLRTKMLREEIERKACVEPLFETMGPLSSYSAKTQLARALDLINDWEYADLHTIRKLRNRFAHTYDEATFDDPAVIELCRKLEGAKRRLRARPSQGRASEKTPRELFTMTAAFLAGRIHGIVDLNREELGNDV